MNPIDYSAEEALGSTVHTASTTSERSRERIRLEVDAVIVGAGPGGLTTASVLGESGMRVAVIEGGQFWPRGTYERKQSWALQHLYQDQGRRVMVGNVFIPVASGRGVGGGTLVNSGISFRAPDRVLDEWVEQHGLDIWERDRREDIFEEVERTVGVAPTRPEVGGKNTEIARRGFDEIGVDGHYMPRNTPGCVGCGACNTGCPTGGKASADLTWLPRALQSDGDVDVYADTRVDTIITRAGRAIGVEGTMRDPETGDSIARVEVSADRVILACGAINTATLLQRNELANSSGRVGHNLHVHPSTGVLGLFEEDILMWRGATQGYYAEHPDDPEVLAETFSAPIETFVTQGSGIGHSTMEFLRNARQIAACGILVRDRSSGTVSYAEGDRPPRITYDLLEGDRRKLLKGVHLAARMYFAAGAHKVMPPVLPKKFYSNLSMVRRYVYNDVDPSDIDLYSSHPMGTCRIGDDPERDIVRPRDGRTWDVEGLYITDSSLFPTALGVNPQITIMAQSLMLARRM
jgi:choline dehydrogenase-like flavoprotein